MANFDKIKIDGTSYMVHDTATATALTAETQARQQAIQNLQSQIEGLPDDWQAYVKNIVCRASVQTIGQASTAMIPTNEIFIATDGNLYYATAYIMSGTTIAVGTNCERTYIGARLLNLQNQISDVDDQITEQLTPLTTRVTNIEANLNSLNVYNFDTCVFIGDSYLNQNPSWGDQLASILPGCRAHYNYPSGGGGFRIAGANGSFLDMVTSGGYVYNAVQSFKNKVTFVLIEGGINDGDSGADAEQLAVVRTLGNAKALFPNARIAVVYNWAPRAYPNNIWEGIKYGCQQTGVPFCSNSYLWLWNGNVSEYFQSDNIHPTTTGTNVACRLLYEWLITGHAMWPQVKQRLNLDNGMTLFWWIDSGDQINIGIYGTSTSNTASLGTMPFCLRPYNQQMFVPWLNVTNLSGTESPFIRWDPVTGAIATNATFSSHNNVSQWNTSIPARMLGFMGFTD